MKKTLLVIDSNSVVHRAYHALPPLTTKDGEAVGAVYGFLLVLFKVIRELRPDFIAACFDVKGPTFRHKKYKEYKAARPPAPPELINQLGKTKQALKVFGVPVFERQDFEADDIIGTIAGLASKQQTAPELETIIISGDTDTLQLVNEKTKVYNLRKGVKDVVLYDADMVKEKYQGLTPAQLVDYRALKGDPSDNIPGVPGIGEKIAIELIREYGSLDHIYENIALITGRVREKLVRHKEGAFSSRELAQIFKNTPIDFNLEACRWGNYNKEKALQFLKELGFFSLINRLPLS